MPKTSRPPIHKNPHILTAVLHLERAGMSRADILAALRISIGTYYRCRDAIEARREAAARG